MIVVNTRFYTGKQLFSNVCSSQFKYLNRTHVIFTHFQLRIHMTTELMMLRSPPKMRTWNEDSMSQVDYSLPMTSMLDFRPCPECQNVVLSSIRRKCPAHHAVYYAALPLSLLRDRELSMKRVLDHVPSRLKAFEKNVRGMDLQRLIPAAAAHTVCDSQRLVDAREALISDACNITEQRCKYVQRQILCLREAQDCLYDWSMGPSNPLYMCRHVPSVEVVDQSFCIAEDLLQRTLHCDESYFEIQLSMDVYEGRLVTINCIVE